MIVFLKIGAKIDISVNLTIFFAVILLSINIIYLLPLFNSEINDFVSTNKESKYGIKKDKNSVLETILFSLKIGSTILKKTMNFIRVPAKK